MPESELYGTYPLPSFPLRNYRDLSDHRAVVAHAAHQLDLVCPVSGRSKESVDHIRQLPFAMEDSIDARGVFLWDVVAVDCRKRVENLFAARGVQIAAEDDLPGSAKHAE